MVVVAGLGRVGSARDRADEVAIVEDAARRAAPDRLDRRAERLRGRAGHCEKEEERGGEFRA